MPLLDLLCDGFRHSWHLAFWAGLAGAEAGAPQRPTVSKTTLLLLPQNELPDTRAKFHVLFLFFVSTMFFVSVLSLFSYHCWLVGKNRTTIGTSLGQVAGGG